MSRMALCNCWRHRCWRRECDARPPSRLYPSTTSILWVRPQLPGPIQRASTVRQDPKSDCKQREQRNSPHVWHSSEFCPRPISQPYSVHKLTTVNSSLTTLSKKSTVMSRYTLSNSRNRSKRSIHGTTTTSTTACTSPALLPPRKILVFFIWKTAYYNGLLRYK